MKLKEIFRRTAIKPSMLYNSEYWAIKKQHISECGQMRMLRQISGNMLRYVVRNKCIHNKFEVIHIQDKTREHIKRGSSMCNKDL